MKRTLCILLALALLLSLAACGQKEEPGRESPYILTKYTPLPESVTAVLRCALDGERLLLCCWEEGENGTGSYAAALEMDGSGFTELPLPLGEDRLLDLQPDGQGGLWCLCGRENGEEERASVTLRRFDAAGDLKTESSLDALLDELDARAYSLSYTPYYPSYQLAIDGEGELCLCSRANATTSCFLFDREGQFLFSLRDEAQPKDLLTTAEGQFAVCTSTDGDWTYSVRPIDMKKQTLEEGVNIGPLKLAADGGEGADYYIFDSGDLYRGSLETGLGDEIFPWSNLGLSGGDAHVCPLSEGKFAVVAGTGRQTGDLAYDFCFVEPGEDTRTVLTMLSVQPDSALLEAVAQFNKRSREYRVELDTAFAPNEDPDAQTWDAALTRINTRLISGDIPDLMDLEYLPADAYSRRGILEDLYPWIASDGQLRMQDYFTNVFTALEIDGSLPYVTSGVRLYTVLAAPGAAGDRRGWTLEEYRALLDSGAVVIEDGGGYSPLWVLLNLEIIDERFVDWEKGTCSYDSQAFVDYLESCRETMVSEGNSMAAVLAGERTPNCRNVALGNILFTSMANQPFGGKAVPIGYPSSGGEAKHILEPINKIGFSTACEHKDGAWAFVRSFLEPELQESSGQAFPYLKSSFEQTCAGLMAKGEFWYGIGNVRVTKADVDLAREVLSRANCCLTGDTELVALVQGQASDYFASGQGAWEAAAEAQSRATMYLGERF